MNVDEFLAQLLRWIPDAEVGEDNDGQLVIYTNMKVVDDEVVSFEGKEAG